jgi:hypothetical protein
MVDQLEDPDPMMIQAEMEEEASNRSQMMEAFLNGKAPEAASTRRIANSGKPSNQGGIPVKASSTNDNNQTARNALVEGVGSHSKRSQPIKGAINGDEEDGIICGRFPHMDVCACDI